jgi:hypothetical protein
MPAPDGDRRRALAAFRQQVSDLVAEHFDGITYAAFFDENFEPPEQMRTVAASLQATLDPETQAKILSEVVRYELGIGIEAGLPEALQKDLRLIDDHDGILAMIDKEVAFQVGVAVGKRLASGGRW